VDSHGNWILGNIDRFEFAEAKAPLSLLPGVNPCGGAAYVQVRTRSSSTASSDLKDTTKIFQYQFGGPTPAGSLTAGCGPAFSYDGSQSRDSQGGTNLTYSWVFTTPLGVTLSGGGVSGSNGIYHATQVTGTVDVGGLSGASPASIAAQLTVSEGGTCPTTAAPVSVDVYPAPTASAAKTSADGSAFSVLLTGSSNYSNGAGPAGASFQWQKWNGSAWVDISGATGTTLTYSGFESDATPTSTTFSIGGDSYAGQLWSVQLRLHVAHTANGATCDAYSAAVTVKKVKAVDP
jgi:hypothetical protein